MNRIAVKMQLFAGYEAEYKRRHDELWPELQKLLKDAGISDYSIFLDESTNNLFAVMKVADPAELADLPLTAVMQKMVAVHGGHHGNKPGFFAGSATAKRSFSSTLIIFTILTNSCHVTRKI